ncbi:MAG: hypothetical protein LUE12_06325 [Ruminococcus sp.]|nr:hypothetical protein [Ruminococcus sp.]
MEFKEMTVKEKIRRIIFICILGAVVIFILLNIVWLIFLQFVCAKKAEALGLDDFNVFSYLMNRDDDIYDMSLKDEETGMYCYMAFPINYLDFEYKISCSVVENDDNSGEGLEIYISLLGNKEIIASCDEIIFEGMTDRGYEIDSQAHEFKVNSNLELSDDYSDEETELFNASLDKFKEQKQLMIEMWGEDIF